LVLELMEGAQPALKHHARGAALRRRLRGEGREDADEGGDRPSRRSSRYRKREGGRFCLLHTDMVTPRISRVHTPFTSLAGLGSHIRSSEKRRLTMARGFVRIVLGALLACAGVTAAGAQQFTGGVRGAVRDANGVIPGVAVTLTNEATNIAREVVTNEVGQYN